MSGRAWLAGRRSPTMVTGPPGSACRRMAGPSSEPDGERALGTPTGAAGRRAMSRPEGRRPGVDQQGKYHDGRGDERDAGNDEGGVQPGHEELALAAVKRPAGPARQVRVDEGAEYGHAEHLPYLAGCVEHRGSHASPVDVNCGQGQRGHRGAAEPYAGAAQREVPPDRPDAGGWFEPEQGQRAEPAGDQPDQQGPSLTETSDQPARPRGGNGVRDS